MHISNIAGFTKNSDEARQALNLDILSDEIVLT